MNFNFDRFYFLGDSLSDTDNSLNLSGGFIPNFPLYEPGRFSNGNIWVDSLAEKLNLTIDPFSNIESSHNSVSFAIGGATSGEINVNPALPGLTQQVTALELFIENQSPEEVVDDDFFSLWIGANDYLNFIQDNPDTLDIIETNFPETLQETEALLNEVINTNITGAIQSIIDLGGEELFIFNLPDLGKIPLALSLTNEDQVTLNNLTTQHNNRLLDEIAELEDLHPEVNFTYIDINQLFNDILDNPVSFGFTNVTDGYTKTDLYTGIFDPTPTNQGADPTTYLFWDSVHPTTTFHSVIADFVEARIPLQVVGGRNSELLNGNHGNDLLQGLGGNDTLNGLEGKDLLQGGKKHDLLNGNDGDDSLDGGNGNDTLNGQDDDDVLKGGSGLDLLNGGHGHDSLEGNRGSDLLNGNNGDDLLQGGLGNDSLNGGNGEDTLKGDKGSDLLNGNDDDDLLKGGRGNDTLKGQDGDDILIGEVGRDHLTGGDGEDIFVYQHIRERLDRITDFEVTEDTMDLSQIVTGSLYPSEQPFVDYIKLIQSGSDTLVKIDHNGIIGNRHNVLLVTLENVQSTDITEENFIFD